MDTQRIRSLMTLALGLTLASFVGCPACEVEVDPDGVSIDEDQQPDWTSYRGLHIMAHRWFTVPNKPEEPSGYGAVDLLEFQNAVYSDCYHTIAGEKADEYLRICDGVNIDGPGTEATPDEYCAYALCAQQLALCAGYKNLELADTVGAVEFSTTPLAVLFAFYDRGRVLIEHKYAPTSSGGPPMEFDNTVLRYKVPPQAPQDRTLLYEAAMEFFREAGIVSGEAIETGCLKPEARASARWDAAPATGASDMGSGSSVQLDPLTMGVAGFQEAVLRFNDALEALSQNETEVAALVAAGEDGTGAASSWNAEVNSRLSAAGRFFGPMLDGAPDGALPVGTTAIETEAQRKAVEILRSSHLDLWAVSDDGLARKAVGAERERQGLPTGPTASGSDPIADFLAREGLTDADFVTARRYLMEEANVFRRPVLPEGSSPSGLPLSAAVAASPRQTEVPEAVAPFTSSFARAPDDPSGTGSIALDEQYAQSGAAQALVYFRDAATFGLRTMGAGPSVGGDPVASVLDNIRATVDALLGPVLVDMEVTACGSDTCDIEVRVFGVPDTTKVEAVLLAADKAAPRDAYECLRYGDAAGVRCTPTDYIVAKMKTADRPTVSRLGRTEPAYVLTATVTPETLVHVFSVGQSGVLAPMASLTVPAPAKSIGVGARASVPAFQDGVGGLSSAPGVARARALGAATAAVRVFAAQRQNVSRAAWGCAGIPEDLVPPLENELTEDSDPYENSWRHYLEAAEQLATEADDLGEGLLARGFQMDTMAEQAVAELRAICGDIGPIDWASGSAGSTDSVLQRCLGGEVVTATLGGPACVRIVDDMYCGCPPDARHDPTSVCSVPCPAFIGRADIEALDAMRDIAGGASAADQQRDYCRALYRQWPPDDDPPAPDRNEPPETRYEYVGMDAALSVFDTSTTAGNVARCKTVRDFRCAVEARREAAGLPLGDALTLIAGYCSGPEKDQQRTEADPARSRPASEALAERAQALFRIIRTEPWFQHAELALLSEGMRMVPGQFHNFSVDYFGTPLWTTAVDGGACPPPSPFVWPNRGAAPASFCDVPDTADPADMARWWCDNYVGPGSRWPAWGKAYERAQWAEEILNAAFGISLVSGIAKGPNLCRFSPEGTLYYVQSHPMFPYVPSFGVPGGTRGGRSAWGEQFTCNADQCWAADIDNIEAGLSGCALDGAVRLREHLTDADPADPEPEWAWVCSAFTGGAGVWSSRNQQGRFTDYKDVRYEVRERDRAGFAGNVDRLDRVLLGMEPGEPVLWFLAEGGSEVSRSPYDQKGVAQVLSGLELACYLSEKDIRCEDFDPNMTPPITSPNDLAAVRRYVECAADGLHRMASSIVLPEVPEELIDGFRRSGFESYFPGTQGQKLEALLAVEGALAEFKAGADGIRSVLYQVGQRFELYRHQVRDLEIRTEMERIELTIRSLQTTISQLGTVLGGFGTSIAQNLMTVFRAGVEASLYADIRSSIRQLEQLAGEGLAEGVAGASAQLMMDVAHYLDQLRQIAEGVGDTLREIQVGLSTLKGLRREAELALSRARFETSDPAAATYHVNTAMRNWLSTDRYRYAELLSSAKRMAFLARRAIEFRLGIDMRTMDDSLALVPAPRTWVDDICTMRGMDYDALSGREAFGPEDIGGSGGGADGGTTDGSDWLEEQERWNGRYVGGYVGDYVRDLRLFVESYPMRYPFLDGSDVAAISLRDDILRVGIPCTVESHNLLYWSDAIGTPGEGSDPAVGGWATSCYDPDPPAGADAGCVVVDSPAALYGMMPPGLGSASVSRVTYYSESLLPATVRPHVRQRVEGIASGRWHALSWWVRRASGYLDPSLEARYAVDVSAVDDDGTLSLIQEARSVVTPNDWMHSGIMFQVPAGVETVEVRIYPTDYLVGGEFWSVGDVYLAGVQLEEYRGPVGSWEDVKGWVRHYHGTTNRRLVDGRCADLMGATVRASFTRDCRCPGRPGGRCLPGDMAAGAAECYFVLPEFAIPLSGVDEAGVFHANPVSLDNFNYRIEQIGINIVGTNVRTCGSGAPESCYGAAYLPFTMTQGGRVEVRNHEDILLAFGMPEGRIEHGKALAAEVYITNPPTTAQVGLIGEYMKDELRGRPVQGNYELRIWDDGTLNWANVEDIQLVMRYRYWTRTRY